MNEMVLTATKYTAATSFHRTADRDTKHVPLTLPPARPRTFSPHRSSTSLVVLAGSLCRD